MGEETTMYETTPLLPRKAAAAWAPSRATRHAVLAALVTGCLLAAGPSHSVATFTHNPTSAKLGSCGCTGPVPEPLAVARRRYPYFVSQVAYI